MNWITIAILGFFGVFLGIIDPTIFQGFFDQIGGLFGGAGATALLAFPLCVRWLGGGDPEDEEVEKPAADTD